jgi:hypothetical protein
MFTLPSPLLSANTISSEQDQKSLPVGDEAERNVAQEAETEDTWESEEEPVEANSEESEAAESDITESEVEEQEVISEEQAVEDTENTESFVAVDDEEEAEKDAEFVEEEQPVSSEPAQPETVATAENSGPKGRVIDERTVRQSSKVCDCKWTSLVPYRERRPSWTTYTRVGASMYTPEDFVPDFVLNETFESYYGDNENAMIEFTLEFKKNFSAGSISGILGASVFNDTSDDGSALDLKFVRLGAGYYADTLFSEPYVVPYVNFGYYYVFYNESVASQEIDGTADGLYWGAGALFQIDWMDREGDIAAYEESGIENSFIYAEMRSMISPGVLSGDTLFDFSSSPSLGAGLLLEY